MLYCTFSALNEIVTFMGNGFLGGIPTNVILNVIFGVAFGLIAFTYRKIK